MPADRLLLDGITKTWPGADRPVLDDVTLALEPRTVVHLSGPNGAGKTTLLRIAAGLIRPERGSVRLGALDVETDRTAFHKRIGFLAAASSGLYARLTVRDHLRFWSRVALMDSAERAPACDRVLDAFELRALADRRVDRLSMGQRQRVRLAGAVLHDPSVVMLDEPMTSLDEEGTSLLAGEVERLRDAGRAVVLCAPSGDVGGPVRFDRRVALRQGRLVSA
ncbi:MAG: type transport system ATP-binding protein [Solirubrobacteraceae bacterium]